MNKLTMAETNKTINKAQDITLEYQQSLCCKHELQSGTPEIPAALRGGKDIMNDLMNIL